MNMEFEKVRMSNPIVHKGMSAGISLEDIIVMLSNNGDEQFKRIMELQLIVPKKIELPNGDVMVQRIPDHLLPLS